MCQLPLLDTAEREARVTAAFRQNQLSTIEIFPLSLGLYFSHASKCLERKSVSVSEHPQNQTLQVVCFGHRQQYGVVARLRAPLDHGQSAVSIQRRAGDDCEQVRLAHMMRA